MLLVLASLVAWFAFFFLDKFGYHTLLKGAVDHASEIERKYAIRIPGIGLGSSISQASQSVKFLGFKTNSTRRLNLFYGAGSIMLCVLFFGFIYADRQPVNNKEPSVNSAVEFLDDANK